MNSVEKHIVSSFDYILGAKLRKYFRNSIWKYLLASVLFAIGTPGHLGGFGTRTLIIWSGLIVLTLTIIFFDSKWKAKNQLFDANVQFNDDDIIINHLIGTKEREVKDWSWIKSIEISKGFVILKLNEHRDFTLFLDKEKLNQNEIDFFEAKYKSNIDK